MLQDILKEGPVPLNNSLLKIILITLREILIWSDLLEKWIKSHTHRVTVVERSGFGVADALIDRHVLCGIQSKFVG